MSNQEILGKAIQKAIDGGWKQEFPWPLPLFWELGVDGLWEAVDYDTDRLHTAVESIIFNHDFAKALWPGRTKAANRPWWHFHLQNMVIAEDPIKYLGENI